MDPPWPACPWNCSTFGGRLWAPGPSAHRWPRTEMQIPRDPTFVPTTERLQIGLQPRLRLRIVVSGLRSRRVSMGLGLGSGIDGSGTLYLSLSLALSFSLFVSLSLTPYVPLSLPQLQTPKLKPKTSEHTPARNKHIVLVSFVAYVVWQPHAKPLEQDVATLSRTPP